MTAAQVLEYLCPKALPTPLSGGNYAWPHVFLDLCLFDMARHRSLLTPGRIRSQHLTRFCGLSSLSEFRHTYLLLQCLSLQLHQKILHPVTRGDCFAPHPPQDCHYCQRCCLDNRYQYGLGSLQPYRSLLGIQRGCC